MMSDYSSAAVQGREEITLRDGTQAFIRPIHPDDAPRLQAFHSRLSEESIFLRYLGFHNVLSDQEAQYFSSVDYQNRMALVAVRDEGGQEQIIGVARYDVIGGDDPGAAEVAIIVQDSYQRHGLGSLLVQRLVAYALAHGVHTFSATIADRNTSVLHFARHSGLPTAMRLIEPGIHELRVLLDVKHKA